MTKNGALGANAVIRYHVEIHAAADIWLRKAQSATLRLNFRTCSWRFGCREMLPLVLPVGAVLTIEDAFGHRDVYEGVDYVPPQDHPVTIPFHGRVQWDEEEAWPFDTIEEANRLLDVVDKRVRETGRPMDRPRWQIGPSPRHPRMVVVEVAGRGVLCVGLGSKESVLSHIPEDGMPPYHTSQGDSSRSGAVWFDFMGEASEFVQDELVPSKQAREAVTHWLQTGNLGVVGWHEA
jgi:hypothetical protein